MGLELTHHAWFFEAACFVGEVALWLLRKCNVIALHAAIIMYLLI